MDKKKQLESQINSQKVIQSELLQLKNTSKVYRKQQNSDIFFLSTVDKEMQTSKHTLDNLLTELKALDQSDKISNNENSQLVS
uniref:Uncharacterized protein n=1 Tax=Arion vulgaris TaxID=1028688 RepID=A0A0B6ZN84_9EUPU